MTIIRLFHATASTRMFDSFSVEASLGAGGEANSALGVHCAHVEADVLRYIEDRDGDFVEDARILVLEADVRRALVLTSSNEFFGIDEFGTALFDHADFAVVRLDLLARGYDAVLTSSGMFDDDGSGVCVILDPSRIRIVSETRPDDARARMLAHEDAGTEPEASEWSDVDTDYDVLFSEEQWRRAEGLKALRTASREELRRTRPASAAALDAIDAATELLGFNELSGGNCGTFALALSRHLHDLGFECTLGMSVQSGFDVERVADVSEREAPVHHVFVEVDGLRFDGTGVMSDDTLDDIASGEYDDPEPVVLVGIDPASGDLLVAVEADTAWTIDTPDFQRAFRAGAAPRP